MRKGANLRFWRFALFLCPFLIGRGLAVTTTTHRSATHTHTRDQNHHHHDHDYAHQRITTNNQNYGCYLDYRVILGLEVRAPPKSGSQPPVPSDARKPSQHERKTMRTLYQALRLRWEIWRYDRWRATATTPCVGCGHNTLTIWCASC